MSANATATKFQSTPLPSPHVVNGIDVAKVRALAETVTAKPEARVTTWRMHSRWMGGTRSEHRAAVSIGGTVVERPFLIQSDEPKELAGKNQFPNPQEYLLAALNACMMVGYSAVAALMGIELTRLEVETSGDIDLRGFLGIGDGVAPGYVELEQVVRIAGSGSAEQFARLHDAVRTTSPNFFTITRSVPVHSRMIVG